MTAHILVAGKLHDAPERRTSKAGKPFATGTIVDRSGDGNSSRFYKLVAFDEAAIAEITRLAAGAAVSVQGTLALEEFEGRDGSRKTALKVIVDHVLALRQPPKPRDPKAATAVSQSWQRPFDGLGDGR